jgi:PAS domain S-box-containing protein
MMRVWSYRPKLPHLGLFFLAYILGCGFAQALAVVPGTGISIWPPSGLFIATLIVAPLRSWPWWVLAGGIAELLSNVLWFNSPLPAALLIYAGNALEAAVGVWLLKRVLKRPIRLETLEEIVVFILVCAGVAPLISATVGSATLAWFGIHSQTFLGAWPLFWIGDATGVLIVAPLALAVFQDWHGKPEFSMARWAEAGVLALILLGVAGLSLCGFLSFTYIVMPPLLWAAVRFELKGAAIALALLALIAALLTISGDSQFISDPASQRHHQIMLQLFLAISAFSALIVAAISRQHQLALISLRQSVEALRDRERELEQIVNMVPVHIRRLTPEGEPTFFNKRLIDFFGLDLEQLNQPGKSRLATNIETLVHADDAPALLQAVRHSVASGVPYSLKYRMRRADGVYRWVDGRAEPLRDDHGAITQWFAISIDIDDEVRALDALRQREQQLQQLIDAVPAMIWCTMPDGTPSYINKRIVDTVGVTLDELIGPHASRSLADIHPDDRNAVDAALADSFKTGSAFMMRYRQRRADGIYRWTEGRADPLRDGSGDILQWYGVCVDIEDLLTTQQALINRELELSQLVDMVPIHVWRLTPTGEPNFVNKRLRDYLGIDVDGYDQPGMSRLSAAMLISAHPDDSAAISQGIGHSLVTGEPFAIQWRVRRADGVYRWAYTRAEGVRNAEGVITQWYGVNIDIDDRIRTEEALRHREREFSQLVDMVPSFLWRLTADGEPNFFNRRLIEFLGFDVSAVDRPPKSRMAAFVEAAVHPDDAAFVKSGFAHAFATGERISLKYRMRRADGVYRWVDAGAEPMRDDRGAIVQWFGFSHDIDDQTRLYSDIAERETRIRRLIDSDIIGIVIWDLDGTLIDANDAFLRMVRYERKDVQTGLRWLDMTPPDWQDVHAREEAEELAATGKMQPREKEYFRKDGSRIPVLIGAACFEGQSRQGVAYILDLTEQKRAEAALRNRERELSQLVDMVPSYLWRISPDGVPVFFNKRLVDFLGFDVADLDDPDRSRLDAFIKAAIHPDDAGVVAEAVGRSLAAGEPLSMKWRMRRTDGTYRWMAASAEAMRNHDGGIAQWYGLCHDIDDQLRSEEALRNSKQQLEQMIDALPINILSYDPVGNVTSASKRYLDSVGVPPDHVKNFEALARHLAHPDDLPVMLRRAMDGFATGTPFVNRFRRRDKGGAYPWIEARAQPLRDSSGAIVQWYQVSIDVEDEMRAQEALRESELQLRRLVDALPIQIWAAAADGEPSYLNRRLAEYVGLQLTDLNSPEASRLQMAIQNSVHPDDKPLVGQALMRSFTTGEAFIMKYRQRRADGVYRWINGRAEPLRDADGTILQWYGVSFDIDDDVRTQDELRRTQERLAVASQAASLAELSASIAHEVNQPLAAIVANSHACHRWLSVDPPNLDRAKIVAERIIRDANAAADIVSRVRALFKQSVGVRINTTFGSVISEARAFMAEEAARRRIRMDIHVESGLPAVTLDSVQIQQVLINLIRNGMDSMEAAAGEKTVTVSARRIGDEVQTRISDHGKGIEFADRIFEPFFTTKENGMGMGLSICRSIVEAHGGRLWAEKNEPNGAQFIFTLPIAAKEAL